MGKSERKLKKPHYSVIDSRKGFFIKVEQSQYNPHFKADTVTYSLVLIKHEKTNYAGDSKKNKVQKKELTMKAITISYLDKAKKVETVRELIEMYEDIVPKNLRRNL